MIKSEPTATLPKTAPSQRGSLGRAQNRDFLTMVPDNSDDQVSLGGKNWLRQTAWKAASSDLPGQVTSGDLPGLPECVSVCVTGVLTP